MAKIVLSVRPVDLDNGRDIVKIQLSCPVRKLLRLAAPLAAPLSCVSVDGMRGSIPVTDDAKLLVINALSGAIIVDKEIDLEEE